MFNGQFIASSEQLPLEGRECGFAGGFPGWALVDEIGVAQAECLQLVEHVLVSKGLLGLRELVEINSAIGSDPGGVWCDQLLGS